MQTATLPFLVFISKVCEGETILHPQGSVVQPDSFNTGLAEFVSHPQPWVMTHIPSIPPPSFLLQLQRVEVQKEKKVGLRTAPPAAWCCQGISQPLTVSSLRPWIFHILQLAYSEQRSNPRRQVMEACLPPPALPAQAVPGSCCHALPQK